MGGYRRPIRCRRSGGSVRQEHPDLLLDIGDALLLVDARAPRPSPGRGPDESPSLLAGRVGIRRTDARPLDLARSTRCGMTDRHDIAQLQRQIAERDAERAQAQAFLDLAVNRSTRDQSQFLNGLIQRKSFSWTRVFEDLEQVMPPNLHVVSLRPELNEQNQMQLEMKVACDTRAAAVELVHRMEGSKHFQGAQLVQENVGSDNGSSVAASVLSIYVPDSTDKGGK